MGRIGDRRASPAVAALVGRLESPPSEARGAAVGALVAAAHLQCHEVLPVARRIISKSDNPPDVRAAALFAVGLLAEPLDQTAGQSVPDVLAEVEQPLEIKYEGIKALGHLRYAAAACH